MVAAAQYLLAPALPSVLRVARYTRHRGPELLTPLDVVHRRAGDCAALACALAGEFRARGVDPAARPIALDVPGGVHVVVVTRGGIVDPSEVCARANGVAS